MSEKIKNISLVKRHSRVELAEHWLLALSGLVLIFSGFGELPMYKRYMVTQLPLLGWAGDFHIQLKIHYVAAIVFVSVLLFHFLYHGMMGHRGLIPRKGDLGGSIRTILAMLGKGKEPEADKFLPEQRIAYAYMVALGVVLAITGLIKVLKNLETIFLPPGLVTGVTLVHTFGTIFFLLGVMAHLGALLIKANRPLLRAIFTGKVDLNYAKQRHTIWWERELRGQGASGVENLSYAGDQAQDATCGASDTVLPGPATPHGCPAQLSFPDAAPGYDGPPGRSKAGEL